MYSSNIQSLTERNYIGLLLVELILFFPSLVFTIFFIQNYTDSFLDKGWALFLVIFVSIYWVWNKVLVKMGFFSGSNTLVRDKNNLSRLLKIAYLFTPSIVFTFVLIIYISFSTISKGEGFIYWLFGFHLINWMWEKALIHTKIYNKPSMMKHVIWGVPTILMLLLTIFVYFRSLIYPEPKILTSNYYEATQSGGAFFERVFERAVKQLRIENEVAEFLSKTDTEEGNKEEIVKLVNLDNNVNTIEVIVLHQINEDCRKSNCDIYIFQLELPLTRREDDTEDLTLIGVLKQITIPVTIGGEPVNGWLNINTLGNDGSSQKFSFNGTSYLQVSE